MDYEQAIEEWEERSAIIEYCGDYPRTNAESLALRDIVARYGQEAGRAVQRYREANHKRGDA